MPISRVLVVALLVVGCGGGLPGDPVPLLTGIDPGLRGNGGKTACYADSAHGQLIVDPTYGTAIIDTDVPFDPATRHPVPVAWRPGFTARRVRSEVAVFDPNGNVVAVTGRTFRIAGGYTGRLETNWPTLPSSMFYACGFVN